jgi:hypothetical protein
MFSKTTLPTTLPFVVPFSRLVGRILKQGFAYLETCYVDGV